MTWGRGMGDDGTRQRRRWVLIAAAVTAGVLTAVGVGLLVRGVVLGETLASGHGWRMQARWSPWGSSVIYREEGLSGGATGLASPGRLTEATSYVPPDGASTYVVGVLPADAVMVRAAPDVESTTAVRRVMLDVFYVVRIAGAPDQVRLEALDDQGHVLDAASLPVAGPLPVVPTDPVS